MTKFDIILFLLVLSIAVRELYLEVRLRYDPTWNGRDAVRLVTVILIWITVLLVAFSLAGCVAVPLIIL